jgi:hypothetical protein
MLVRRFLVLAALCFWQGGFTFYSGVVIPLGIRVLGGHRSQARLTAPVARALNVAGAVALPLLAWDSLRGRDPAARRRLWRGLLCLAMLAGLAVLLWLHPRLDAQFDAAAQTVADEPAFRSGHRLYLWVSAAQWACALAYLALTLAAWRAEDRTDHP